MTTPTPPGLGLRTFALFLLILAAATGLAVLDKLSGTWASVAAALVTGWQARRALQDVKRGGDT